MSSFFQSVFGLLFYRGFCLMLEFKFRFLYNLKILADEQKPRSLSQHDKSFLPSFYFLSERRIIYLLLAEASWTVLSHIVCDSIFFPLPIAEYGDHTQLLAKHRNYAYVLSSSLMDKRCLQQLWFWNEQNVSLELRDFLQNISQYSTELLHHKEDYISNLVQRKKI